MLKPNDYRVDTTILLPPVKLDKEHRYYYCPQITSENLNISIEGLAYEAIAVLPYQTKSFDFNISKKSNEKIFFVEYFYLDKYDHLGLKDEMSNPKWFSKYEWKRLEVTF